MKTPAQQKRLRKRENKQAGSKRSPTPKQVKTDGQHPNKQDRHLSHLRGAQ
jgi:hypothetical protein